MLIVGTGGLAKEILGIIITENPSEEITFYDENIHCPDLIFNKYKVLKTTEQLCKYFNNNSLNFIVGIGHPRIREKLTLKIQKSGGKNISVVSKNSSIFNFNQIPAGTIIEPYVGISHGLEMNVGCAIHIHASIGHASKIGKYVNIGPSATIIGPTSIGDYSYIGAKALILPNLTIGKNVIVAAGAKVTRNLNNYETFIG